MFDNSKIDAAVAGPSVPQKKRYRRRDVEADESLMLPGLRSGTVRDRNLSTVESSPADHSTVDRSPVDHSTVDRSPVDRLTVDSSSIGHSTVESSPVDHSTVDSSPVDHSTVESSPVDHSTVDSSPVDLPPLPAPAVDQPEIDPTVPGPSVPQKKRYRRRDVEADESLMLRGLRSGAARDPDNVPKKKRGRPRKAAIIVDNYAMRQWGLEPEDLQNGQEQGVMDGEQRNNGEESHEQMAVGGSLDVEIREEVEMERWNGQERTGGRTDVVESALMDDQNFGGPENRDEEDHQVENHVKVTVERKDQVGEQHDQGEEEDASQDTVPPIPDGLSEPISLLPLEVQEGLDDPQPSPVLEEFEGPSSIGRKERLEERTEEGQPALVEGSVEVIQDERAQSTEGPDPFEIPVDREVDPISQSSASFDAGLAHDQASGQGEISPEDGQAAEITEIHEKIIIVDCQAEEAAPLEDDENAGYIYENPNLPGPSNRPIRTRVQRATIKPTSYREPDDIALPKKQWIFGENEAARNYSISFLDQRKRKGVEIIGVYNYSKYPKKLVGPAFRFFQVQLAGKEDPQWIDEEEIGESRLLQLYKRQHKLTAVDEERKEKYEELSIIERKEEADGAFYLFQLPEEEPQWVKVNGPEWNWADSAVPGILYKKIAEFHRRLEIGLREEKNDLTRIIEAYELEEMERRRIESLQTPGKAPGFNGTPQDPHPEENH